MGIFKKTMAEDPTKPLEETAADTSPVVEPAVETPAAPDDRSAYNCTNCQGEGLILDKATQLHKLCPVCLGKGKVS